MKIAPTLAAVVPAATEQLPVPAHAPLQPLRTCPLSGVAVKLTLEVEGKLAIAVEHATPQEIPAGLLLIVPFPVLVTVIWRIALVAEKLADTFFAPVMPTEQPEVPEHAPPHPENR